MHYAKSKPDCIKSLLVTNSVSAFSPSGVIKPINQYEDTIRQKGTRALPIHPWYSNSLADTLKNRMIVAADNIDIEAVISGLRLLPKLSTYPFIGTLPPTIVANGIYEKSFQPIIAAAIEKCPELKSEDLNGGHAVNINCADAFNKIAIDFFLERFEQSEIRRE